MFRRLKRRGGTAELIGIGRPAISDLGARLDEVVALGRRLADSARGIHTQREFERWQDELLRWRSAAAETLEKGLTTTAARDELLESWSVDAPVCAVWTDELKVQRARLDAALDFAGQIRSATAAAP
jgi:hypothetical protein